MRDREWETDRQRDATIDCEMTWRARISTQRVLLRPIFVYGVAGLLLACCWRVLACVGVAWLHLALACQAWLHHDAELTERLQVLALSFDENGNGFLEVRWSVRVCTRMYMYVYVCLYVLYVCVRAHHPSSSVIIRCRESRRTSDASSYG